MLGWGPASFVVLFVLSLRHLIIRASSRSSRSVGLRIKGRPAEDSESGRLGGRLDSPTVVVAIVLPIGYLPSPSKDKEKISEIRHPCGSEYLRASVRYTDAGGGGGGGGGGGTTRPIIFDLPSSHNHWKERYFFIKGGHWEYNPTDQDDTLGIPKEWIAPANLREFSVYASRGQLF